MINIYLPATFEPLDNFPSWYKNYYSSFTLTQVTNNVLLMCIKTLCSLEKNFNKPTVDDDVFFNNEAKAMVSEVIQYIQHTINNVDVSLTAMGIHLSPMPNEIRLSENELYETMCTEGWYSAIKGMLNNWEFIALYSSFETALKQKLRLKNSFKNSSLFDKLRDCYKDNTNFDGETIIEVWMVSFWDLYTHLRNIYTHNNGIFTSDSINSLSQKRDSFIKKYESSANPVTLSFNDLRKGNFFKKTNYVPNKFCFVTDNELNMFRNTISYFLYHLAKSDISLGNLK